MEIGRTETLQDTLNPVWQKKVVLDYNFEKRQFVKFCVFDSDSSSTDLESHDFLGSCECSLGEVVAAQSKGFSKKLVNVRSGVIRVHAEELTSNKGAHLGKYQEVFFPHSISNSNSLNH